MVVKGPKGSLTLVVPNHLAVKKEASQLVVSVTDSHPDHKSRHGLFRTLVNNAILGVTRGWERHLELVGVGYKAHGGGNEITLNVGFTHQVKVVAPANVSFQVTDNTKITVSGIDKKMVGEIAAKIRAIKPPEPYKGKGIRYTGEVVRKKAGKAVKAAGSPA